MSSPSTEERGSAIKVPLLGDEKPPRCWAPSLRPDETTAELVGSMERIKSVLGIEATEFAIPFGRSSDWTKQAQSEATQAGYEIVYAYTENRRFPGTVGRTAVTRFDGQRGFAAILGGAFDNWQEWI